MQLVSDPLITGTGCGAINILVLTVVAHAEELDSVSVIAPLPFAGQVTVMELLLLATMVPPVTFQL